MMSNTAKQVQPHEDAAVRDSKTPTSVNNKKSEGDLERQHQAQEEEEQDQEVKSAEKDQDTNLLEEDGQVKKWSRRRLCSIAAIVAVVAVVIVVPCVRILGMNDSCEKATELEVNGRHDHDSGSFKFAAPDPQRPALWYEFYGTGSNVNIQVHNSNDASDGFQTFCFTVYEGDSCDKIVESSSKTPFGEHIYNWGSSEYVSLAYHNEANVATQKGIKYHLYVKICWCETGGNCLQYPRYTIYVLDKSHKSPENDFCYNALPIFENNETSRRYELLKEQLGYLRNAAANDDAAIIRQWEYGNDWRRHPPAGIWYVLDRDTLLDTGPIEIIVTTHPRILSKNNFFKMVIFEGEDCNNLNLVMNEGFTIYWDRSVFYPPIPADDGTVQSSRYYIMVVGEKSTKYLHDPAYMLKRNVPPPNVRCDNAIDVPTDRPSHYIGSTFEGADLSSLNDDNNNNNQTDDVKNLLQVWWPHIHVNDDVDSPDLVGLWYVMDLKELPSYMVPDWKELPSYMVAHLRSSEQDEYKRPHIVAFQSDTMSCDYDNMISYDSPIIMEQYEEDYDYYTGHKWEIWYDESFRLEPNNHFVFIYVMRWKDRSETTRDGLFELSFDCYY